MKTRDIRDLYKSQGERFVITILETHNEEIKSLQKSITELAMMQDKIIDSLTGVMTVAGNMKDTIDRLQKPQEEDLGSSTQGLMHDSDTKN